MNRRDFRVALSSSEICDIAADASIQCLQTLDQVNTATWERLNAELFTLRPDIELRVYGFYGKVCDLSFLRLVPNVRRFSADCLIDATGVEYVVHLRDLEQLRIGIYHLDSFEFLESLDEGALRFLSLYATRSKKPRLRSIGRFGNLEELYLEGQQKDLEAMGDLKQLAKVTLRSLKLDSIEFLLALPNLWSLGLKLGGAKDLSGLGALTKLKYLELWQILGLTDIGFVSEMTGLQYLSLQSLCRVRTLPDLSRLGSLRRIYLDNLKSDISVLATGPALEELVHLNAQGFAVKDYESLIANSRLKRLIVGTGSIRKNEEIRLHAVAQGIETEGAPDFEFWS
jgi:hypothetical protein